MKDQWQLDLEERIVFGLRELYRSYGYLPYKMGKFEEYELYALNRKFLRSDRILTFTDTDGRLMALRPDVTLSIVRNYGGEGLQKLFYHEAVFRPADSGFKEIRQCGLECIGKVDLYQQSEVFLLAAKSLEQLSSAYLLDVSQLGFISSLVDALFSAGFRKKTMRFIEQKNAVGIRAVCEEEGLPKEQAERLIRLTLSYGTAGEMLPLMKESVLNDETEAAFRELSAILALMPSDILEEHIRIDLSMIDDLQYYNGLIFRGLLPRIPEPVLSGGRYDSLLRKMDKSGAAIGFAVYMDLLPYLAQEEAAWDTDVLLRYDADTDPADLIRAVSALREQYRSVRADAAGEKIRARITARMERGQYRIDGE